MKKILFIISIALVVLFTRCKHSDVKPQTNKKLVGEVEVKKTEPSKGTLDPEEERERAAYRVADTTGIDPHSPYWYDPAISEPQFSEDGDTMMYFPRKRKGGHYVVPEGVTYLQERVFQCCMKVRSIIFPKSLKHIEMAVCDNCPQLRKVVFKSPIREVPFRGFTFCRRLRELHLVDRWPPVSPYEKDENVDEEEWFYTFGGVNAKKCVIFVPKGCAKRYKRHRLWRRFKHIVEE